MVEDNLADVGLVREALEEHGVEGELIVAFDGESAMSFLRDLNARLADYPDLFIIDLNLPKRPGSEVLAFTRQSERCRQTPVVVLSSSDAQEDRAIAAALGAHRYLRKPLRLEEFLKLGAVFKAILEESGGKNV